MTLSYLFLLESNQSSVMLRRSTRFLEHSSGKVLIGTEHPMTFHLPLYTASQTSCASHGPPNRVEYKWLCRPLCSQWSMVDGDYVVLDYHYPVILCLQYWRIFKSNSCWSIVNVYVLIERFCVIPCWNQQSQISPHLFCFGGSHCQVDRHWLPANVFKSAQQNGITEHGTLWWTSINGQTNVFYYSWASMKRWQ